MEKRLGIGECGQERAGGDKYLVAERTLLVSSFFLSNTNASKSC